MKKQLFSALIAIISTAVIIPTATASGIDKFCDTLDSVNKALDATSTTVKNVKEATSPSAQAAAKANTIAKLKCRKTEALTIYNTEITSIQNAITNVKNSTILSTTDKTFLTKLLNSDLSTSKSKYSLIENYYNTQLKAIDK